MGTYIGRPPINRLHQLVRETGGDLPEQLRQLRIVARDLRVTEAEVDQVRGVLFQEHGYPRRER